MTKTRPRAALPDELVANLTAAVQRAGELLRALPLDELEHHFYDRLRAKIGIFDQGHVTEMTHVINMLGAAQSLAHTSGVVNADSIEHQRRRAVLSKSWA